ncbi:MAG: hypothetical protein AAF721_14910 [Myxococcota bacterium]
MRRNASLLVLASGLVGLASGCDGGVEPNPFETAQLEGTDGNGDAPASSSNPDGGGDTTVAGDGDGGGTTSSQADDATSTTAAADDGTTVSNASTTAEAETTVGVDPGTSTGVIDETTTGASTGTTGGVPQLCPDDSILALPMSVSDSTLGADDEFSSTCGGVGAPDFSYLFTAPADGNYRVSTAGSQLDTVAYVLDGSCGGNQIECNDDDGCGGTSSSALVVALTAGQMVTVVVDGFGLIGDDFSLTVDACTDCTVGAQGCGGGTTGG